VALPKARNRQTQKTKRFLQEALLSLMSEKSYESILVQDILDRADIGRSTFYMHYQDKDALLVGGLQPLLGHLKEAQESSAATSSKKYERVIGFSLAMFEHAHGGRRLYKALSGGQGWMIVQSHIEEMLIQMMKKEARPLFKGRNSSEVPFELFVHYLGSTFTSVMTWWLNQRNPVSPEEINDLFRGLVIPTLAAHLG
jgi:AcrR family transcriptional regulator